MRVQNIEGRIQNTEAKITIERQRHTFPSLSRGGSWWGWGKTEPALTPALYPSGHKSLRARERGEKGKKNIFPVMLSPGLRYIEALSKHFLIFCTVFAISACGGGGGGSSPTGPSTTITLSAATPGINSVYMARNSSLSSGTVLAIDIKVDSVSNVFGAAFDIDFDSTKMTYSDKVAGNFLESGGNTVNYMAELQSGSTNKVIVVVTRQAPAGGLTGSGTLVTLKFNVTGGGSVDFSNAALKDSSLNTIAATWSGGTVMVQ